MTDYGDTDLAAPINRNNKYFYKELKLVSEFTERLRRTKELAVFTECIRSLIVELGFTDFSFGWVAAKYGADGNFLTTLKKYIKIYLDEKYYLHDMIQQHCEIFTIPIFHSTLENIINSICITNRQFERNLEMIHQYRKLGYHDFYTVPCNSLLGDHYSIFSITAKNLSQDQFYSLVMQHHTIISLSSNAIDVIGLTNFPKFFPVQPKSEGIYESEKSLRLVETLVRKDYTLKRVAGHLHISIRTANNRVETFKNALGARTMNGAVYLALKKGLISLEDKSSQQCCTSYHK